MKKSFFKLTSVLLAVVLMLSAMITVTANEEDGQERIYECTTFTKDRYLPNNEGCAVTTLFVNDAIAASSDVSGLADGEGFTLTPEESNYLKFEYEATEAGMYSFAVQYYRKAYPDCERCFDFAVDDMGQERVSVPGTNDIRWVVISVALEAGKHTFTLSSASGSVDTSFNPSATWLGPVTVYEFKVWTGSGSEGDSGEEEDAKPSLYNAQVVENKLPDLSGVNIVFEGYVNDAIASHDSAGIAALADGEALVLKELSFAYLTFTFEAPVDGTYSFSVEYYGKEYADCDRCFDFAVDGEAGFENTVNRERISVPGTSNRNFAIIPVTLTAGTHTFSVYAPVGDPDKDYKPSATWVGGVSVYSFKVWNGNLKFIGTYDYSCENALSDLSQQTVVLEGYANDATDSWSLAESSALADGAGVCLKDALTHMTFTFNTPSTGTYFFAVEYSAEESDTLDYCFDFAVDGKAGANNMQNRQEFSVKRSNDGKMYLITSKLLAKGTHTFSVYAPRSLNAAESLETVVGGETPRTIASPMLYSFRVWTSTIKDVDYTHTFEEKLTDFTPSKVLLNGGIGLAVDSFDMSSTSAATGEVALCLRLDFNPSRTHLTFEFDVIKAGTHTIAIEYIARVGTTNDRVIVLEIDDLGRDQISLRQSNDKQFLVVTQEFDVGKHTFTVYAPDNVGEKNDNGLTIQSCDMYSFKVYRPIPATSFKVQEGAAVRMDATQGELRSITRFDKDFYNELVELYGANNLSFGTVFGKADDAATLGTLTKEAFNIEAYTYWETSRAQLLEDENGYYFYGYFKAENEEQYDLELSFVSYIRVSLGGKTQYIYTQYDPENNRSIAWVAAQAAADVQETASIGYENAVVMNETTVYSPYKEDEYASLVALAAYNKED